VISNTILKMLLAVVLGRGKFRLQAGAFLLLTALILAGSVLWLR
jgi:hypothetical protein